MKKTLTILLALMLLLGTAMTAVAEAPREAELNIMMSFPQYMDQWQAYATQFEQKMLAEKNVSVRSTLKCPAPTSTRAFCRPGRREISDPCWIFANGSICAWSTNAYWKA